MHRITRIVPFLLTLGALLAATASTSRAIPGGHRPVFPGRYELAMSHAEAQSRVEVAIDSIVGRANPLVRAAARARLQATNRAYRTITLADYRGQISVQYDDARYITERDAWRTLNARGEQVRLLSQLQGRHLYQTFVGHDGQKRMVLTVDGNSLWLDVTAEGRGLPAPVQYRLPYRRAE